MGYFEAGNATTMAEPPQGSDTSFRRRFAELSLEKKLSIFFVPVFAAVVGTLVPRFLGGDGGALPPNPVSVPFQVQPERTENLEFISMEVKNSRVKRLSYGSGAELRVLVRNTGTVDSVIRSAEFRVAQYEEAELCLPPAGNLDVTGTYDLTLPSLDGGGRSFEVDLQQRIPAGKPDLFSFKIRLDDQYVPTNGDSRFYVLDVFLYHDTEEEPLEAGPALVALPFPSSDQFADARWQATPSGYFDPECPGRNRGRLDDLVAADAERSAELEQFAVDPYSIVPSELEPRPEPSRGDEQAATAAASGVAEALALGDGGGACELIEDVSVFALEEWSDLPCAKYVDPLQRLVSPGSKLELVEAHPGWIKLVAPKADGRHQLALLVQATSAPGVRSTVWEVTNVYDVAEGPLPLNAPS